MQSVLNNKNQSLSRFFVQTLLVTFVVLNDHSLGVRSLDEKKLLCFHNEQKILLTGIFTNAYIYSLKWTKTIKDRDSTVPKRGSVFIGLMISNSAIWSRYQRTVLMR